MRKSLRGQFTKFNGSSYRVAIVVAQFNRDISAALLVSAQKTLRDYRVPAKNIKVWRVAGAVEIPVVLQKLARSKKYDCLVALGTIIKGDTEHFHYVAKMAAEGILRVMLDYNIPVGFGVLTVDNLKQAKARLGAGGEAAEAALQATRVIKEIK
jgi:6,7-dimethyl-8-ribityllumazine synthase